MSDGADYRRLMSSSLGAELSLDEAEALAEVMTVHNLAAGQVLIEEAQTDNALYILVDGKIEVSHVGRDAKPVIVHVMRPGEFSGVMGFIDGVPRTATLRSVADSTVYELERAAFEALVEGRPRIAYKLMRGIVRNAYNIIEAMNRQTEEMMGYFFKQGGRY
jgi:CRP/FNR family cyclic AMP-dependent transcriptional regulator